MKIAVDKATNAAKRLGAGEDVDPDERKRLKLTVALAKEAVEFSQTALDEAVAKDRAAAVEVRKAQWHTALRAARRLRRCEGECDIEFATAASAFMEKLEAARAATEARLSADEEAEGIRCELAGIDPAARIYRHPHELETRRFMSALDPAYILSTHIEWPAGVQVDFRTIGERNIALAAD